MKREIIKRSKFNDLREIISQGQKALLLDFLLLIFQLPARYFTMPKFGKGI
jgi:hypothetical protein